MDITTNYNVGEVSIENGYITLSESLGDYPKLTIQTYQDENPALVVGTTHTDFGLVFVLEGISVDICPIAGFQKQVVYNFIHISKKLLEYPINTYDFVHNHKGSAVRTSGSSYYFSLGTLISYAQGKVGGSASGPSALVEISKTPSPEETITIKQHLDEQCQLKGLVYQFIGGSVSASAIGTGVAVNAAIVANYTLAKNAVPTYKRTPLSWSKKDNYENNQLVKKTYRKLDSNEYVLYTGDFKAHLPPGEDNTGSVLPRDLSIMMDNSGITKSCKLTKYKWGQPEVEISATFGYANAALELVTDPARPNSATNLVLSALSEKVIESGNAYQEVLSTIQSGKYGYPDDVEWRHEPIWRIVSIKETYYDYEPLHLNINPVIKKADGSFHSVIIPEEYKKFLFSNLEVLVSETSFGWELKRFAQEDAAQWTKGSISAWNSLHSVVSLKDKLQDGSAESKKLYNWMLYSAKITLEQYLYRKIPLWERVDYAIVPYSKYYKNLETVDWQVEMIPQSSIPGLDRGNNTPIPVLFPDPNWAPELMIVARSRYKSSFGVSGNPQYNPFVRNYYGSNPVTVSTGSEEYEFTKYGILSSRLTKPAISELHDTFGNVQDVISGIVAGMAYEGTVYKEHPYMTVNDYGIKGVPIPQMNPGSVLSNSPGATADRNDQYTTLTSIRVAQDQSFKSYITTQTYSESEGRPPNATLRKPVYEEVADESNSPYKNSQTYVTSDISNGGIDIVSGVSVSGAQNIQEAISGAQNQLMLNILMSGSTASVQLVWNTVTRSLINGRINLPQGNWIIKNSTQTVQVSNGVAFPQPIQIEAGNYMRPGISAETIQIANENTNQDSMQVLINADLPYKLGTPITELPANFSRWLV
jgi:hypothetical protein